MGFLRRIGASYVELKFRTKLLLNFFAVSIVVIAGLTSCYYVVLTNNVYSAMASDVDRSVAQLSVTLGHVVSNIHQVSERMATNSTVYSAMSSLATGRSFDEQIEDYAQLRRIVNDVYTNNVTIYTTLYFQQDAIYLGRGRNFLHLEDNPPPWRDRLDMRYGRPLWTNPFQMEGYSHLFDGLLVGMARITRDYSMSAGVLGVVSVYASTAELSRLLQEVEDACGSRVLLVHEDGAVLTSTQGDQVGLPLSEIPLFDQLEVGGESGYKTRIGGEQFLVHRRAVEQSDWRLISLTPVAPLRARNRSALLLLGGSMALACLVLLLLDSVLSRSMTWRVKKLLSRVVLPDGSVGIDPQEKVEFYNELRQIIDAFADMQDRNQRLSQHILQEELEKKEAQLSAMQAQIDSHFLYNSLDVINWMALEHGAEDISHMVQLLSRFYRISLSKGNEIVPLRDELAHVQTYLEIQKIRFEDAVMYTLEVEPGIESVPITKLVLQPIAENAIIHGLMEKPEPGGHIAIQAVRAGAKLRISVSDDGVGIPPEKLETINRGHALDLEEHDCARGSNFGLRNIRARLRLYYRETAELHISSSPEGTRVEVVIPITGGESDHPD